MVGVCGEWEESSTRVEGALQALEGVWVFSQSLLGASEGFKKQRDRISICILLKDYKTSPLPQWSLEEEPEGQVAVDGVVFVFQLWDTGQDASPL